MPDGKMNMNTAPMDAGSMKRSLFALLGYCRNSLPLILIALLCAGGSAVLSVLGPGQIARLTNVIQSGITALGVDISMERVARIGLTLAGIYIASAVLGCLQGIIMNTVSCQVGRKMRSDISGKIHRLPLRYFDTHSFGDTLSRVTNDVDSISQSMNNSVGSLVSAAATLLGCGAMMLLTEWRMALAAMAASVLGFAAMGAIMGRSQAHFNARQRSLAQVNAHVEEYVSGQSVVRAYNAESAGLAAFREGNEQLRRHTFRAEFLGGLMMPLMSFVGNLGYVAVCVVGAVLTCAGEIGFDTVVAFMIYVRLFTSPLGQVGQGFSSIQSALAASRRVMEFLQEQEMEDETEKTQTLPEVTGHVTFRNVRFGYDPGRPVIHDFSVDVKAGQKVAIVGPTGAGKTTVVNLLMRFYELDDGAISVDGVPLSQLTRENVHRIFGMVLQDTWLFAGTVRDNLAYGKEGVSDARLWELCCRCGLEHFLRALPQGLDTVLDDSLPLSAGEKQLLTIARAMVQDPPMLILDEATSSVDTRTEQAIQAAMDALTKGRTSFVIAHRLSTIRDADLILYMRDGDILEAGTHQELMALGGQYAQLYNSQFLSTAA